MLSTWRELFILEEKKATKLRDPTTTRGTNIPVQSAMIATYLQSMTSRRLVGSFRPKSTLSAAAALPPIAGKPILQQVAPAPSVIAKDNIATPLNGRISPIVTTHSRRLIPTNATNHFVRLTLTDVHLKDEQLPFCYFFKERLDPELLESSLKNVLQHFPILGGSTKDGLSIQCSEADHVPLSFGEINMSLQDWLEDANKWDHVYNTGAHPTLLPIFDSIFSKDHGDRLAAIRVTYFECGGTAIGVNMSHVLGDTASCVRFVQCWGKEMRGKEYPRGASLERRYATTSAMMTEELAEVMSYGKGHSNQPNDVSPFSFLSKMFSSLAFQPEAAAVEDVEETIEPNVGVDHEYVRLKFPLEILTAMKAHGMMTCKTVDPSNYVSTNDVVTAFGWLLKRAVSGYDNWDLSVVVNIRGRFGVDDFSDLTTMNHSRVTGVFGNGITNIIANFRPTQSFFDLDDISQAALSIRQALHQGNEDIPNRIAQSRMGRDSPAPRSYSTFATTSWSQFPVWGIKFSPLSELVGFHGHPAHPLPTGRTFSSVIMSTPDGGCIYKVLLPRDKAEDVRALHSFICTCYMEWHAAYVATQAR